jgi:hypothetical protein
VEVLISFALVLVSFGDYGLFFSPRSVCNNWPCTFMDVEAGFCNTLSRKKNAPGSEREAINYKTLVFSNYLSVLQSV